VPITQPTIQEPRQSWRLAAANAISKITPVEPVWCVHDVVAGTYRFKKDEEENCRFQPRSSRDAYREIRGVQC
jgi:hypothetical protein